MEKKILLPTDFSKNALNAARYALDLFREDRCAFFILNTYHSVGYPIDSMVLVPEPGGLTYEEAREQSEMGLEKFLAMLKLHPERPTHRFETSSIFGTLLEGVKQQIDEKGIDLVVMGTRGATDAEQILFGTNTVHMMEQVLDCPVLAVPAGYRYSIPRHILFPTGFEFRLQKSVLRFLLEIATVHRSMVHILHMGADQPKEQISRKRELNRILVGIPHEFHFLDESKVARGISLFLNERPCEMIVFMNRKHSFLEKLLKRPLVKELGYHPQIPILELNVPK